MIELTEPLLHKIEALEVLMSNWSEENYCAGWLIGLEYLLWEKISALPELDETLTADTFLSDELYMKNLDLYAIKYISKQFGFWLRWDKELGVLPVQIHEWEKMYAAKKSQS